MNSKFIAQGAEAVITLDKEKIIKSRIKKSYRHPKLDFQIRKSRSKAEAKILAKCLESEINVPKVLSKSDFDIDMEYIKGDRLSETLNSYPEKKQFQIMKKIGKQAAKLHEINIIHGDLTTSNMILKVEEAFLIDFGLSFISSKIEDKAVDIHLIKQALEAKHYLLHENLFKKFLERYIWEDSKKVLERLKVVEKRGRYKH